MRKLNAFGEMIYPLREVSTPVAEAIDRLQNGEMATLCLTNGFTVQKHNDWTFRLGKGKRAVYFPLAERKYMENRIAIGQLALPAR